MLHVVDHLFAVLVELAIGFDRPDLTWKARMSDGVHREDEGGLWAGTCMSVHAGGGQAHRSGDQKCLPHCGIRKELLVCLPSNGLAPWANSLTDLFRSGTPNDQAPSRL